MNLGVLVSQDCEAVRVSMIDGSCGPRVGCGVDQTLTKLSSPRLTFDRALVVSVRLRHDACKYTTNAPRTSA